MKNIIYSTILMVGFAFLIGSVSAQDNFYYGNLHSHTSYSDGMLTPDDAFAYAKDVSKINFLAITDHDYMLNNTEYEDMLQQANNHTKDGIFVAIQGFEWSSGNYGHIPVINTSIFTSHKVTPTLIEIYSFVRNNYGIAFFAHPAWPGNRFEYFSSLDGDDVVDGIEVGNGYNYEEMKYATFEYSYIEALDKGWHVGAIINQDNHHANWGNGRGWIAVIAPNLTKQNILTAIKDKKYYGTEDRNFELIFKANGHWMGEKFIAGDNITFNITLKDNDIGDNISSIDLYEDGKVIKSISISSNNYAWTPIVTPAVGSHYYFIKVTEEDGDRIWSSPIWTIADYDVRAIGLSFSPDYPLIGNDTILTAKIINQGTSSVEVKTNFYYDYKNDEHLIGIVTKNVSSDEITTASINWTAIKGTHTIYAVILPINGDNPYDNNISREIRVSTGNIKTRITASENFGMATNKTVRELFDITMEVPLGTTALEALKSVATVNEAGGLINGINGIEADYVSNLYWFYFVNGITAQVGAGDYILNNSDVIRFDYQKWAPNAPYCEVLDYPEPFFHGYNGVVWNTTIVYPNSSDNYEVISQSIKDKLVEHGVPNSIINIKSDAEITSVEKEKNNLILIGTPSENKLTDYINSNHTELGMTAYFEGERIIDLWDNITYYEEGLIEAIDNPYDGISTWMVGPVVWLISGTNTNATMAASRILIEEPNKLNRFWVIIPKEAPWPNITSFAPHSPVHDDQGAIRTFYITANQTVNVTWYINGTHVQFNESVMEAQYTNTSAAQGIWNVTAVASNSNGITMQIWIWIVTPIPTEGSISGFKVNDTNGNGKWDAGEKGISNWTIRLIGITGKGKEAEVIRKETFTDATGFYNFDNLSAGRYFVIEKLEKGFVPTSSPVKRIKIAQGKNSMNNNFTNRPVHSLNIINGQIDIDDYEVINRVNREIDKYKEDMEWN
ncbi:MAG: CehA/McbA family metallohydrolase [Candidatus Methanoperedens sp.]|nr:CehA/McbA family metallohydrolase [Candidatus Methanoperedens sp.]